MEKKADLIDFLFSSEEMLINFWKKKHWRQEYLDIYFLKCCLVSFSRRSFGNNWETRGGEVLLPLVFRTLKEYGTLRYYIDTCLGVVDDIHTRSP